MALQDDIMAMLSQISDAGDRATDRGRRGEELYGQIADRLSGDNRSKALREIAMLSGNPEMSIEEQMRFDPLTGSRVADIIEKYMDDAGDGVPAAVPAPDMIVDDTRAAMEVMPSPDTAPRTPVTVEPLEPMLPPGLDEAAMASMEREIRDQDEGLAGLMAGMRATPTPTAMPADEFSSISPEVYQQQYERGVGYVDGPRRAAAPASVGNTVARALAAERAQDTAGVETRPGDPRSRVNAPELASDLIEQFREMTPEAEAEVREGVTAASITALTSLPPARLANIAIRLGIGRFSPQQIARNPQLRRQIEQEVQLLLPKPTAGAPSSYVVPSAQVGTQGRQAAQAAARARQAAAARARAAARGEGSGPAVRIEPSSAQRLGSTQGSGSAFDDIINRYGAIGMAEGMSVRDKILKTYGGM
jgi:hypothetical protein